MVTELSLEFGSNDAADACNKHAKLNILGELTLHFLSWRRIPAAECAGTAC